MKTRTKPINNSHKKTRMTAKICKRGERVLISPPVNESVSSGGNTCTGVLVAVGVLVLAGKISVIAGSGTKVVVGASVGVDVGVNVWVGALVGLGVVDPVTNASTSA